MNDLHLVIRGIEKTESLNVYSAGPGKFRLNQDGSNMTKEQEPLNPPFRKCPQYVQESKRILITHANNPKRFFLFIDVDIHECPEPLKKWRMLYRVKHMLDGTTRNSYHIILEITDTDQAGLDKLAGYHRAIPGLEMWSKLRGFALLGSFYGEMEGRNGPKATPSEWQFMDEETKVNVIRGIFPKCTRADFVNEMYKVAGGKIIKSKEKKARIDPEVGPVKGERNEYFTRMAYKYAHTNTQAEVLMMMKGVNQTLEDPWDGKSLEAACSSAFDKIGRGELGTAQQNKAFELLRQGFSKQDVILKMCNGRTQEEKNLIKSDVAEAYVLLKQSKKNDTPTEKPDKEKERMDLIKLIEQRHRFTKIRGDDRGLLYENNRVYEQFGEDALAQIILTLDPERDKETRNYTIQYIKDKYVTPIEDFDKDHTILNFQNTFVKITKDGHHTLKEADLPEGYKSMKQHPVIYNPDLGPSKEYTELVKEILPDEWQSRLELSGLLWLRSLVNPEKLFIHDGDGANGKSTLMHIDAAILGEKNITSVKPEEISEDAYAGAELYGKFACITHDISDKKLDDFNMLKSLAMRDEIVSMQHKYGHRFDMKNHAVIQAACNRKPQIGKFGYSEARRLHIITYTERYEGNEKKKEYHKSFLDTEDKKSQILNTMLDYAVKMLNSDGKLTDEQKPDKVMEIWGDIIPSIVDFVRECTTITNNKKDVMPKKELYELYKARCKGMHSASCEDPDGPKCCKLMEPETQTKFSRMLTSYDLTYKVVSMGGTKTQCWIGLRYTEPPKEQKTFTK